MVGSRQAYRAGVSAQRYLPAPTPNEALVCVVPPAFFATCCGPTLVVSLPVAFGVTLPCAFFTIRHTVCGGCST